MKLTRPCASTDMLHAQSNSDVRCASWRAHAEMARYAAAERTDVTAGYAYSCPLNLVRTFNQCNATPKGARHKQCA